MQIVTTRARLFWVGIVVAASANASFLQTLGAFQTPAAEGEEPYSALVTATQARVVFPVPELAVWEWCRPETRDAGLEYSWTATVENGGQGYTFGFFLFKCLRSGPPRGTFDMLLRAGQMGVTEVQPNSGRLVRDAKVGAVTTAARLTLVVNDARTLRLLFSERPMNATLKAFLPGQPWMIREVPITYSQP